MKNYISDGDTITATAPYARSSGDGALIGSIFGVAKQDVSSGATGEWLLEGVVKLTRTTGSSSAWTEGALLYWDDSAKSVTKTASSNKIIGVGVLPLPGDSDTTGYVRLNGHTR